MTQGGQRFRRRALRRGYKADEVDAFLARAEATLAGEPIDDPVTAQEVHDVVFRVRFGGYDEWQVDVYLDRLERQLAELEEHGGHPVARQAAPAPMPEEPAYPGPGDRGYVPRPHGPDPEEPSLGYGPEPGRGRYHPGFEPEPDPTRPVGMPERGVPQPGLRPEPEDPRFGRLDEPTIARRPERPVPPPAMPPPGRVPPPAAGSVPMPPPRGSVPPPPGPVPPPMAPPPPVPAEDATMTQQIPSVRGGGFDVPGRHGKLDMTTEIRTIGSPFTPEDAARVEQLRRTFQVRRFGSGYDRSQVDRLFDAIRATMSGQAPVAVTDGELDPGQFSLVPGGYFEAEVDAALREVRDMFARRGVTR